MSPKIHAKFWTEPELADQPPEIKFTVLWMISNPMTHFTGTFEVSPRQFESETNLHRDWLEKALVALPRMFVRAGGRVWLRTFIRHQFGQGEKLVRNNMGRALAGAVADLPGEIREAVWGEYPELKGLASPPKPLPSPSKGLASPSRDGADGILPGSEGVSEALPSPPKPSEGVRIGIGIGIGTRTQGGGLGEAERGDGPGTGLRFDLAAECLEFLNKKTGSQFLPGPAVLRMLAERLAEVGNDAAGVCGMIERQCGVWPAGSRMRRYLQPHTLFEEQKFHSYFGQRGQAVAADPAETAGRIKMLREQIERSPANRDSTWHSPEATAEERAALKHWRKELAVLADGQ